MPRQARGEYLNPAEIQIVHTVQRCVRQAFLCGDNVWSGQSFEHRRQWIRDRLEFLASAFGIDCLTYTVLSNHLHIVLRSRPDVVAEWSDDEVARRWLQVFPERRTKDGEPESPSDPEIKMITSDAERLAEIRLRLSDISWWMRCTAEKIAKMANKEDQCKGRFWEGRFKAQLILDEPSLLACAAYVDLNPIRAAMAQTPERSEFTGAKDRIDDLKARKANSKSTHDWERSRRRLKSGWMSPIEIDERTDPAGADLNPTDRRASGKGFLSMSLTQYLELLDWTGKQLARDKRGAIPQNLAPILDRIGIEPKGWCELVRKFGRLFRRAAGSAESISSEAQRRGLDYMHAPGKTLLSATAATS